MTTSKQYSTMGTLDMQYRSAGVGQRGKEYRSFW